MSEQHTIQEPNNTIISGLLEMAEEGGDNINNFPSITPVEIPLPEAKVLLTIENYCSCGSILQHTNPFLLIRFGTSYHKPEFWARIYEELPSERIIRQERVEVCGECFS